MLPPKGQLSVLFNFFFPFIDIGYFSQVLNSNSIELNRFAKQVFLETFFKSDGGHANSRQEKRRCPKAPCEFPPRKDGILHPSSGCLGSPLPLPLPQSLYGWAYANVTTKISRIDGLANFLHLSMVFRARMVR